MTQPSPAAVPEDEAALTRYQWSPRPSYHDLRRFVKPELAAGGGDNWVTNSSSTSATSRSPSPATPSESSQYYAASTSSWATSQAARSATDCGLPNDDEPERCGNPKWPGDEEASRMPFRRPATPVSRFARSAKDIAARSPSRPSSLRNAMSVRDGAKNEVASSEHQETDISESEGETIGESDTDNDDDNEWSGQNGNLESLVIAAVDGDLSLAAFLVPVLHHEFQLALKSKVESWQSTTTRGSADGSPGGKPGKGGQISQGGGQDGGNSRKRRRRSSSDGGGREARGGGGDGDEGDEDEDRDGDLGQSPVDGTDSTPTLACPFHKRDPVKYGIQPGNSAGTKKHKYRGCIGPGYKSIQRLKEHLKRVHSPVQCDRCYEIFPGSLKERAACLARLAEHRKMDVSCERGDASNKEGIDEFQWAILDKQSRKKNQEAHRLEKWFEIWDVLFPEPGVKRPDNPWNDLVAPHPSKQSAPYGSEDSFAKLFVRIMEHKVQQKEIDPEVFESIRGPLVSGARQALRAHINIRGLPSTETSSSESKNRPSLGSSAQLSAPATTSSNQLSATTAATSMTAGSPIRGRPGPTASAYTLSPPAYHGGMGIPMARQPSQQPQPPPQFTHHMSPIPQPGNIASFGAMPATDDNFYAFNYIFPPPPPPHHQGHHPAAAPWATGPGNVQYSAGPHAIAQNYTGLPHAVSAGEYYGDIPVEVRDYGQGHGHGHGGQEDV